MTSDEAVSFEGDDHLVDRRRADAEVALEAIAALPNAVNDALVPFGVVVERQPLSPMYLLDLLRGLNAEKTA